ncbi:dihydropyrimidine dehydrogenase subunit A [Bacteroidia bacterium]|nr:dihydropyrimidine dehydrogenase subunit A [Bacteroidia bacterium]
MGNPKGFLTINKKEAGYRPVHERVLDFGEVEQTLNSEDRKLQASRCMDCGVPFCHWACPLGNKMPEWQDLIYKGKWKEAAELLQTTNDFPEFTGRICPALCEKACVLNYEENSITIRENEAAVMEYAFEQGYVTPNPPKTRTGKKVAVIGGGPAGLAAANQLNKRGHSVTVFEKDNAVGGLLRFGIPDFKLNKLVIDRRLALLEAEGIEFKVSTEVGKDIKGAEILKKYDAVVITIGAGQPRDLPVEGRDIEGVYFALQFLQQQNHLIKGDKIAEKDIISAKGKNVLVIGGGDTGSDCVGTSIRQGAKSVTQIEILPKPSEEYVPATMWPDWPNTLRTSSSHKEGCNRRWNLATKRFIAGTDGKLSGVEVVEVVWGVDENGKYGMKEIGTPEIIEAELVTLAMGFVHPVHEGLLNELGVAYDGRGNVAIDANTTQSSVKKVFAAGDAASGASLVVRAIAAGRKTAEEADKFLK